MKKLIILLFSFISMHLFSQVDCKIHVFDTTVCAGSAVKLWTGFGPDTLYYWEPPGVLSSSPLVEIEIYDTTTVYLKIFDGADTSLICEDSLELDLYPRVLIELDQLNKGCPEECKAQVKASANGGFPPYRYVWNAPVAPNDSSLALGLCTHDAYSLFVFDTVCIYDTMYKVIGYDMPEIELSVDPGDTVYLVNPQATFYFENKSADSIPLTNWVWIFGDGTSSNEVSPTHVFMQNDTVKFTYTTLDGCDSTILKMIFVKELELEIPNVFTPNGDGINDFFVIENLEQYTGNDLVVINRWGQKIHEASNYNGDWGGGNNPDGTYFYILKAYGLFEEDTFRGTIAILGSGN